MAQAWMWGWWGNLLHSVDHTLGVKHWTSEAFLPRGDMTRGWLRALQGDISKKKKKKLTTSRQVFALMLQTQIGKVLKKMSSPQWWLERIRWAGEEIPVQIKRIRWWKDWNSGSKMHVCFLGWRPFNLEKGNRFPYVTYFTTFHFITCLFFFFSINFWWRGKDGPFGWILAVCQLWKLNGHGRKSDP